MKRCLLAAGSAGLLLAAGLKAQTVVAPTAPSSVIVGLTGSVQIQRPGWRGYDIAEVGTLITPSDLVRRTNGSQATVLCADMQLKQLAQQQVAPIQCARNVSSDILSWNGADVVAARGAAAGGYPVVISPRKTRVLDAHPVLKWMAVPGVPDYAVSLEPAIAWRINVSGTEIRYPSDAPALQPNTPYLLRVVTIGPPGSRPRSSDAEGTPGLSFSLLDENGRKGIVERRAQISALGLDRSVVNYIVARLYAASGVNSEAIALIESIPNTFENVARHQLLGELYLTIGLPQFAQLSWERAQQVAIAKGALAAQGAIGEKLGDLHNALGRPQPAMAAYTASRAAWVSLGAMAQEQQLADKISAVSARLRK